MRPEHFAEGKEDEKAGVARLFALASGTKEPEAVRVFAQTYLRCNHPRIGKEQPESKQLGIKPAIARQAYTLDRVWPGLWDTRGDVRRFAVLVTRAELRRWGAMARVYELAESTAKEVRKVAYDALLEAGERHADPDLALLPEELDAAQIFSMTESRMRSSRDVGIELIRKHYARIGGAERLGWLMQTSPCASSGRSTARARRRPAGSRRGAGRRFQTPARSPTRRRCARSSGACSSRRRPGGRSRRSTARARRSSRRAS
jgi:hypothetical protein